MRANLMQRLREARLLAAKAGPYLLIEILLPGGTLIALLLFLYQRTQGGGIEGAPPFGVLYAWAIGKLRDVLNRLQTSAAQRPIRRAERDGLEPLAMSPMH